MTKKNTNAMSDALVYIGRREIHPGKGSSIRKLIRGARISAGLRPLRRAKRQFFPVAVFFEAGGCHLVERAADLHFTKGYRPAVGVAPRITALADDEVPALAALPWVEPIAA